MANMDLGDACRRYLQLEARRVEIIDGLATEEDPQERYRAIEDEQRKIRTALGDEQFSRFAAEWL